MHVLCLVGMSEENDDENEEMCMYMYVEEGRTEEEV